MRRAPTLRRWTQRDSFLERRRWLVEGLKQGTIEPDSARRATMHLVSLARKLRRRGEV